MSSARTQLYTMAYCPYCEAAKRLLKERGVAYDEIKLGDDDGDAWDALEKRSGMKTMPQIFHGDRLIGGYRELSAEDAKDRLASLKA